MPMTQIGFRVRKNAASLKRFRLQERPSLWPSFRVRKNAASLKHQEQDGSGCRQALFPRSKERGLIEAGGRTTERVLDEEFPRSKERGLIEALVADVLEYYPDVGFRVRKNAASLKHCLGKVSQPQKQNAFPRSKERGLIEAGALVV